MRLFWPIACMLLAIAPLTGLPPLGDETWKIYHYGAMWASSPQDVILFPLGETWRYLTIAGNFRPLGRILEHANYLFAYGLIAVPQIPLHLALGIVRAVSLVGLVCGVGFFTTRLGTRSDNPHALDWTVALLAPLSLVALAANPGGLNALDSFSGLYIQSAVFVVLIASLFAHPRMFDTRSPGVGSLVLFGILGAAIAGTNEILYFAVPISITAYVTLSFRRTGSFRSLRAQKGSRLTLAMLVGFALVFVPARVLIALSSASDYEASSVSTGGLSLRLLGQRIMSGLPYHAWDRWHAFDLVTDRWVGVAMFVAALGFLYLVMSRRSVRQAHQEVHPAGAKGDEEARLMLDPVPMIVVGIVTVVFAALLSSLSAEIQSREMALLAWKETPVSYVGWSLLLTAALSWLMGKMRWRAIAEAAVVVVAAVMVTATFASNTASAGAYLKAPRAQADVALASQAAFFDETPIGNNRRLAAVELHRQAYSDIPGMHYRVIRGLNTYSLARFDVPFADKNSE